MWKWRAPLRVGLQHRLLEAREDVIADCDGVGDVFERQPVLLHGVEPEEVCFTPVRENQEIVGDRPRARLQAAALEIDGADFHHPEVEVLLAAQNGAHRLRDLVGLEPCGRDLIQERLEEMVVVAIEQNDLNGSAAHRAGGTQAAEPRAHNHDSWDDYLVSLRHSHWSGS